MTTLSTIRMTFEGMMVLFIANDRSYCDVGILKQAPHHAAGILITRLRNVGAPEPLLHIHDDELEPKVWLDVHKALPQKVSLFIDDRHQPPFNRPTGEGNPRDFRWVLDFEGSEMYREQIGIDMAGFKSVLRINDGTFYTQETSSNKLVLKRPEGRETIGPVAVRIQADIELGQQDKAYFSNGNHPAIELVPTSGVNYGIYVSQARHADHTEHDDIDAENYNLVLAVNKPPSRKIHFDRAVEGTPDAVCLTPQMGQTTIG